MKIAKATDWKRNDGEYFRILTCLVNFGLGIHFTHVLTVLE